MVEKSVLLVLVLSPLLGIPFCLVAQKAARWITLCFSAAGLFLVGWLYFHFDATVKTDLQWRFAVDWFTQFGIRFGLGVDGLSLLLVLLTKLTLPIAVLASWSERRKEGLMMACYLLADSMVTGCLLATDVFLFYSCYEFMLIPLLLLVGVWGGAQRISASLKFFIFTAAGSFLMLAAILWVFNAYHSQFGVYSADIASLARLTWVPNTTYFGFRPESLCFLAFALAFAVKIPVFPLHAWLPAAYVEAPTGGTIYLSAVLSKLGIYGLLRLAIPLCPTAFAEAAPILGWLGAIGCLYGAMLAFRQSNLKALLAYSSFSHLGLILVGVATATLHSWNGVLIHLFNHGLTSATLFLLAGMLFERRQSYQFADLGGLAQRMPRYAFFLALASFSSMALPGLNGFVGEFLILLGTFQKNPLLAAVLTLSTILTALYLLRMIQVTLLGEVISPGNRVLKDLAGRDLVPLACLALLLIALGIHPGILSHKAESFATSQKLMETAADSSANAN